MKDIFEQNEYYEIPTDIKHVSGVATTAIKLEAYLKGRTVIPLCVSIDHDTGNYKIMFNQRYITGEDFAFSRLTGEYEKMIKEFKTKIGLN